MNAKSLQSKPASPAREKWQSYRETVGYAKHVIFHGVEHDSWVPAYEETNLIDWLAAAKKKK